MNEFLIENYFLIIYSSEALAAVIGLFSLRKYKSTVAKYFIFFLIYSVLIDFSGNYTVFIKENGFLYFLKGTIFNTNYLFLTFFWIIVGTIFYLLYFRKIIKTPRLKIILKFAVLLYVPFCLIGLIVFHKSFFEGFVPFIQFLSVFAVFLTVSLYFYEILNSEIILTFYKSLHFYIASTVLIWWLIITPMIFHEIYFSTADWNFVFLKWQIFLFANVFMYLSFSFALLWCKPEND